MIGATAEILPDLKHKEDGIYEADIQHCKATAALKPPYVRFVGAFGHRPVFPIRQQKPKISLFIFVKKGAGARSRHRIAAVQAGFAPQKPDS